MSNDYNASPSPCVACEYLLRDKAPDNEKEEATIVDGSP